MVTKDPEFNRQFNEAMKTWPGAYPKEWLTTGIRRRGIMRKFISTITVGGGGGGSEMDQMADYKLWLARATAQMPETPNQKLACQRAGWLTQEEIDRMKPISPPSRFRRILNWLNGEPGGAFTLFFLVMFCLGMWFAVLLWRMIGR